MNATSSATRRSTSFLALALITLATLTAVLAGTHYADAAMVRPASHSVSQTLPAPCRAAVQLPGYSLPGTAHDHIRGLTSGRRMVRELLAQHVSRPNMIRECTGYLYTWASDHPKAA